MFMIGSAPAGAVAASRATSVTHRTVMRIGAAYPRSIRHAAGMLVHTCIRVRDIDASVGFYEALGFEKRGKLDFGAAYNIYMGLPGDGDRLELTVNVGREEPYDLGDGYNHFAITVDDIHAALEKLAALGVEPEKPAYHPGQREELPLIAFVADPDGYRIELIDGEFPTPQDD